MVADRSCGITSIGSYNSRRGFEGCVRQPRDRSKMLLLEAVLVLTFVNCCLMCSYLYPGHIARNAPSSEVRGSATFQTRTSSAPTPCMRFNAAPTRTKGTPVIHPDGAHRRVWFYRPTGSPRYTLNSGAKPSGPPLRVSISCVKGEKFPFPLAKFLSREVYSLVGQSYSRPYHHCFFFSTPD